MASEAPAPVVETPAAPVVETPAAPTTSLMDEAPTDPAPADPALDDPAPTDPADPAPADHTNPADPADPAPEPIEYGDFSAPDGVELDTDVLTALKDIGKTNGWTQEQAQSVVDLGVQMQEKLQQSFADSVVAARAEWREQTTTDAEFGGANLQPNLAIARQARETFGTPALKELLDQSGLGDHPEVVRFFYKVGKATSEHDFVVSGKPSQPASFYDHPTSKK